MKTQGEIEAAISEGMNRFEQEYMGRGPIRWTARSRRVEFVTRNSHTSHEIAFRNSRRREPENQNPLVR
jgi:uncharacterized protein YbcI